MLARIRKVYVAHPQFKPCINEFIEESASSPNGSHDDQVDANGT